MRGILTAELKEQKESKTITGTDSLDLTMQAIKHILNSAINNKLWAKDKILLKDRLGNILKEMPAKE